MPSYKFMNFHNVRAIDFSGTGFHDTHMIMLADYLGANPYLYSVVLDRNPMSDQAMTILAGALKRNKKLSHLSIKGCDGLTNTGLKALNDVIVHHNMVLF
jgi:hypothetical protein